MRLRSVTKPIICQVQGAALAGALLLVCNATHVLAADSAKFSAPEILRGIWPFMVMAGLFRVMPRRRALDFVMRGYKIEASQALADGLVTAVVPAGQLPAQAAAFARELAALSPATLRLGLEAFYHQEDLAFAEAIPCLRQMLSQCLATEDAREGIAAFMQNRPPQWTGR